MKLKCILLALAALTITACGSSPEPTANPADIQSTAMAAAQTIVAETQAAFPTATLMPPTIAPSATAIPTNTSEPFGISSATLSIGVFPTNTPVPASVSNDPCNQPLTTWDGDSAKLIIYNNTKPKGLVTISLYFTTSLGQCGYIGAQFNNTTTLSVPMGTFSVGAFVDGNKDFKVFGGDVINRIGKYTLWVENDRIILKAGCSPNC